MAFKFVVLAAALACAHAGLLGAPVVSTSYISAAAPVAYAHAPAIGASHQSVVRSLGGNQAVSTYSKAVDSAFSSVRKFDTRVTNDALLAAPLAVAHAAPAALAYSPAAVVSHVTFDGVGAHYAW